MMKLDEAGSESNSATLTFDGVDKMGERLANEVVFGCIVVSSVTCNLKFDFYV
jgi:hypothetical protein